MLRHIANHEDSSSLAAQMRRRRMQFFEKLLDTKAQDSLQILDVGGTLKYWEDSTLLENERISVTVLNLVTFLSTNNRVDSIQGDATDLSQWPDNHFDVVFSNSVIEHVGQLENQKSMANEVCRVSKSYYVQTPNYYFPLEPHFLFPGFQWLPISLRALLHNRFHLGWMHREPDYEQAYQVVLDTRLLKKREIRELFPNGDIFEEKIFGLTKSFVAYGGWST